MRAKWLMRLAFVFACALFVSALARPVAAFEACGAGPSPPPVVDSDDESGIGGTGIGEARPEGALPATQGVAGGDDSESGLGGTGIFGTVTRTDRLCVNGLEIQVPERLSILASSGEASERAVALGMVVWVRAQQTDEGLLALQIRIHPDLAGQVETITQDGRELVVSGHPVRLPDDVARDPALQRGEPSPGQWIVVHGLRDASGTLVASRIELGQPHELRAEPAALAEWLTTTPSLRSVSIEGYLTGTPDRPQLAGLDLELGPERSRELGERLQPGARVRLEGRLTRGNVLVVERPLRIPRPVRVSPMEGPTPSEPQIERPGPRSNPMPPSTRERPSTPSDGVRPPRTTIDRPRDRPRPPRPERPATRPSADRL